MPRKSIYDQRMAQLSLSLPVQMIKALQQIAKDKGTTVSAMVRPVLEKLVNQS